MSAKTGVNRIATVLRGLGVLGVVLAIGGVAALFSLAAIQGWEVTSHDKGNIFPVIGGAVLVCGLLWAVAWVMDGFVKD